MDDTYQTYVNRVIQITRPETYRSQLQHIQKSAKFQPQSSEKGWQAAPFPGYTVITPPWIEDQENTPFYNNLKEYQQQLVEQLDPVSLVPVPPDSFHLTLADLIWDSAYRHANENPEFEGQLRDRIARILQQYQPSAVDVSPVRLQLLGLMVMTRAIGVCLAPKDEESYERIVRFRRAIYQDPGLMALGIEQQYHFTAHVTLGYFVGIPSDLEPETVGSADVVPQLSNTLNQLNEQWMEWDSQELLVQRAELRKFDDMTRYYREPDWPVLEF